MTRPPPPPTARATLRFGVLATVALALVHGATGADGQLPKTMPAPPARPAVEADQSPAETIPTPRPDIAALEPGNVPPGALPAAEKACRARLVALKVEFEDLPPVDGEGECGIAYPVSVKTLGSGVELTPDGLMNCATAVAAAQFVLQTVKPATKRRLRSELTGIRHASAYVCRNRASGEKISEHARGNALDVSAFVLADGREVAVEAYGPAHKPERRFMAAIRKAACGPFSTVLGPGTDADHAQHFHFDLAKRRRGSTYCR